MPRDARVVSEPILSSKGTSTASLAPVPDFALGRIPRITFGTGTFVRIPGIVAATVRASSW